MRYTLTHQHLVLHNYRVQTNILTDRNKCRKMYIYEYFNILKLHLQGFIQDSVSFHIVILIFYPIIRDTLSGLLEAFSRPGFGLWPVFEDYGPQRLCHLSPIPLVHWCIFFKLKQFPFPQKEPLPLDHFHRRKTPILREKYCILKKIFSIFPQKQWKLQYFASFSRIKAFCSVFSNRLTWNYNPGTSNRWRCKKLVKMTFRTYEIVGRWKRCLNKVKIKPNNQCKVFYKDILREFNSSELTKLK